MHKGRDCWGRAIDHISSLHKLNHHDWDVCFLQEVCGYTLDSYCNSEDIQVVYGFTRVSNRSHYGNAILSRVGNLSYKSNLCISASCLEQRRLLCSSLIFNNYEINLCCTHFGLRKSWRAQQCAAVLRELESLKNSESCIIGGDFNDWGQILAESFSRSGLHGVTPLHGQTLKSFPAQYPLLSLDRVYATSDWVGSSQILGPIGKDWHRYSDHLPIISSFKKRSG